MADEKTPQAKDSPQKQEKAGERQAKEPLAKDVMQKLEDEFRKLARDDSETAESADAKYSELNDKFLRLSAEFDNYKKRTAKEKEQLSAHSEARVISRLLPIYEEIGLAESEVAKISDKAVRDGALLVLTKLRSSFEKEGLQQMKVEGEKLDPFRHEVAFREDSGAPEGEIVRVIRPGYLFKGEMLQHALVSVSSGKKPDDGKKEEKENSGKENPE